MAESDARMSPLFQAVKALQGEHAGEAQDILRLMWTLEHNLTALSRRMESREGTPASHRAVLRYVSLFPGISASKLCEMLQLHPSTLSHVFKRLATSGFLERRDDPDDLRRARLFPTGAGTEVLSRTAGTVDAAVERVVRSSPPEKLKATREVLQRLVAELQVELG